MDFANSKLRSSPGHVVEIRPSSYECASKKDILCYGVHAMQKIKAGTHFLREDHPFAISLEQQGIRCYNCFEPLDLLEREKKKSFRSAAGCTAIAR